MLSYEIRDTIFDCNQLFTGDAQHHLGNDDLKHFLHHQELYIVAKLLPDLKYLGAPLKIIKGGYSLSHAHPNPYWIDFIKEIRRYLDCSRLDIIKYHIEKDLLPPQAAHFLRGLYS